ncbi:hypothetical protein [Halorientalis salina]|uniref:hypothetical protein n=1 Tax=Halorientalis salina TaxID=2932266 RepID=UPI0010AD9DBA|nr:hypothetical protein [Halorientalis salina]
MNRRHFVTVAAVGSLAGCSVLSGRTERGQLDLTVQNERADPVSVLVEVVDDEGTTYEEESDRIESSVARTFEVTVGTDGRHEVTVTGDDWQGQLGWNAGTCALFDGTVRVTDGSVEVASECVDTR